MAKKLFTFKNKKGEVIAQIRAEDQAEALYGAGINSLNEATVTSAAVDTAPVQKDSYGHPW